MGYTTEFDGAIQLGRKLTMSEARELLEIAEGGRDSKAVTGIDAYFQWVPADTLQHIVWDQNEKFYQYIEQLQWLCRWLGERNISANGLMYWHGEESSDTGTINVVANEVAAHHTGRSAEKSPQPLTLRDLQEMALEQITAA
jgi:hypothetical protein